MKKPCPLCLIEKPSPDAFYESTPKARCRLCVTAKAGMYYEKPEAYRAKTRDLLIELKHLRREAGLPGIASIFEALSLPPNLYKVSITDLPALRSSARHHVIALRKDHNMASNHLPKASATASALPPTVDSSVTHVSPPAADAPPVATIVQLRAINARLDNVYPTPMKGYINGMSDTLVAKELNMPLAWVRSERERLCGPEHFFDTASFDKAQKKLVDDFGKFRDAALNKIDEFEDRIKQSDKLIRDAKLAAGL